MNHHEGVQCDVCVRSNFRGCRYKCLICFDYDLCSECFERGLTSRNHSRLHPMQSVLTRSDVALFFGGEDIHGTKTQSFTCPYCGELGLTGKMLLKHLIYRHANSNEGVALPVLCPICATRQNGNNNFMTTNLPGHLAVEHRIAGPRSLVARIDEATAESLRNPPVALPSTPTRRNASSRSSRNSMDAVFLELMSHLPDLPEARGSGGGGGGGNSSGNGIGSGGGGVAAAVGAANAGAGAATFVGLGSTANPTSVQAFQQIQMQFSQHQHQMDHRLGRRAFLRQMEHFMPANERGPPPVTAPSNTSRRIYAGARSREAAAIALQAAIASEARRYTVTSNGRGRAAAPSRGGSTESIECSGAGDSTETNRRKCQAEISVKTEDNTEMFALKKFLKQDLKDIDIARRDHRRADRSLFVQALLLSAFSKDFKTNDRNKAKKLLKEKEENNAKEKKRKKKKNKKNNLRKQYEGVCVGGTDGQSSSKVLARQQSIKGGYVGNSQA